MADLAYLMELAVRGRKEREENEERWWYLSFTDEKKFKGAILVRAHGIVTARLRVGELGFNPAGEVLGVPVPEGAFLPAECCRNRLLTADELDRAYAEDGGVRSLQTHKEEEDAAR